MLLPVKYLLDRLIGPRTRADELHELRRRLLAQDRPGVASPEEVGLAKQLRRLREEFAERLGAVQACAGCVRPRSTSWPGGHCCSGRTQELFTDDELAALRLSGTTVSELQTPCGEHVGCAFRGASGCTLAVGHRTSLCATYLCRELEGELERRGDGPAIARIQHQLRTTFEQFVACRKERIEANALEELETCLRDNTG